MKKYVKYLTTFLLMFTALISSVSAVTIKETLIEGDGYSTIEDGSIVIGITKFSSDTVVTGGRATKAGSDAALMYIKLNGNADGFETPVIYVYAGGGWFALDKDNNASVVEDQAILDDLSNKDIYYVNDDEKLLDIDVSGINIDTSKLPKGVTYENGKLWVKATKDSVTVVDKDGAEYKYVKERGLFTLDKSECYQVNGNEITGYSNTCSKNVIIPSKVGDTEIVSVGADAFRNKGIKTVVIPKHIISLKDNAFADNSLESVTIEDKYDETDFDVYGQNVFGSFKDEDIIWKNELTAILNQFDDEIEIKVSETFKEHEFEYKEEELYTYGAYAKQQQFNKVGINVDENGYVNGKYSIMFWIASPSSNNMEIEIYEINGDNYAIREVPYELVVVEENNNDYLNIKEDYEEYFKTIRTKMENKDFSQKLTGIDGLIDISDNYNYEVLTMTNGIGDGPLKTNSEPDLVDKYLIYNGALHYVYKDMPYYSSIFYPVAVDSELSDEDDIFAAMKKIFEEETDITEYEVYYEDSYGTVDKFEYVIELEIENTNENYVLYYFVTPEKGKLYLNYEGESGNSYTYYPTKTLSDFDGDVLMYFENAFTELDEKYNTGMDYSLSSYIDYSEEPNSDELYDAVYSASIDVYDGNNKTDHYTIDVNNPKATRSTDQYVEAFVELDNNKAEEEYEQDVLNKFFEEKDLEHYYIFEDEYEYFYDEETGKYDSYYYMIDTEEILKGFYVFDFDTNTRYIVLYKDFYDREPGTLFKDYTYTNEYDEVLNYYRYIPSSKYTTGKVSDYVETLGEELRTKANISEETEFSFSFSGSSCQGPEGCTVTYQITFNVNKEDGINIYKTEFEVYTDTMYEHEYIHNSTVNPDDYSSDLYDNMVYSECINGLGLTDYYIYRGHYYYDEEHVRYEIYDFANNRKISIIAKRFALG